MHTLQIYDFLVLSVGLTFSQKSFRYRVVYFKKIKHLVSDKETDVFTINYCCLFVHCGRSGTTIESINRLVRCTL